MNPLPQKLTDWLTETLNRFFSERPQYYKYWSWLSYAGMALSGIPYVLNQFPNIHLTGILAILSNKAVTGGALIMFLMSRLPVKTPMVGQTESGLEVKVTDKNKMPFTAKAEQKEIDKTIPPPETLSVPEKAPEEPVKIDLTNFPPSTTIPKEKKDT